MKKIILSIIISSVSVVSLAEMTFNMQIPQPDFVSNDWDNDGINNSEDTDDDNDGVLDENDSSPFDTSGQSSTPSVIVNGFQSNKISYLPNELIILSWSVENIRSLFLYDDANLTNLISDVTEEDSISLEPVGDVIYYLNTETSVETTSVYQINEVSRDCSEWAPDVSTQDEEVEFEQTQSCVVNYASAEPYNYTVNETDTQQAMGTKETIKCYYDSNNRLKSNTSGGTLTVAGTSYTSIAHRYRGLDGRHAPNGNLITLGSVMNNINGYVYLEICY